MKYDGIVIGGGPAGMFAAITAAKLGKRVLLLDDIITTEQYGIGFKLGNDELRDKVQNTLNEMVEDGTFTKIAEKWELTDAVCLGK